MLIACQPFLLINIYVFIITVTKYKHTVAYKIINTKIQQHKISHW